MSLFDSITRTVKGLLNDAADTMQDPSRDARQIVRELDDSIAKAENSLIEMSMSAYWTMSHTRAIRLRRRLPKPCWG